MKDYRSLTSVVVALAFVQAAVGALSAFAPLTLLSRGEPATSIGLVASAYGAGFLLGALKAPSAIGAIGHIRAFAGFAAIATVFALALFEFDKIFLWMALQAGLGACVATLLTTGESWIADVAPRERRGALLGFYLVLSKCGQISGPLLMINLLPGEARGFMVVAALLAVSLVPITATRRTHPATPSTRPFGPMDLWRIAPAAVMAAFVAGAVNGSVLQLYSLYAAELKTGDAVTAAAYFNAAIALGSMLAQWPAGWLSDRSDRRLVIAYLAAIGCLVSLALCVAQYLLPNSLIYVLALIWGAGALSFYGIAVAHASDRAGPGQATGMMSGILVVWAFGAIVGPLCAGIFVQSPLGASGLFLYAALGLGLLCGAMFIRRRGKSAMPLDEKSPFAVAPATSIAIATIDPRSDDASEPGGTHSSSPPAHSEDAPS